MAGWLIIRIVVCLVMLNITRNITQELYRRSKKLVGGTAHWRQLNA
jgi:hypothetical protein